MACHGCASKSWPEESMVFLVMNRSLDLLPLSEGISAIAYGNRQSCNCIVGYKTSPELSLSAMCEYRNAAEKGKPYVAFP